MKLIYHPDAEAELIEAARYYESRVATLGTQFLAEASRAVGIILKSPKRWAVVDKDIRRYLMSRFPFGIYYRVFSDRLHILAFKHHSRHPDYWRDRVSD